MQKAKKGDVVEVHYTGKLEDGSVFDSSMNREPLQFKLGGGQLLPDFDRCVAGMSLGESKTIKIQYEKGYGARDENLVMTVDRSFLPSDLDPEIGQHLQLVQEDGGETVVKVVGLTEKTITLDGNHPLAGKNLEFEIKLVAIR